MQRRRAATTFKAVSPVLDAAEAVLIISHRADKTLCFGRQLLPPSRRSVSTQLFSRTGDV